jgi:hypothetical protein
LFARVVNESAEETHKTTEKEFMKSWLDSLPLANSTLRRAFTPGALAVLLIIYVFEVTGAARDLSPTWNEPYHLLAGYTYWQRGDYGVNPEHPPLAKLVGALPLLFMQVKAPRVGRDESKSAANKQGKDLVYGNDADALMLRARLAEAGVGLILILLLFEAGYRMFGLGAAWIATVLAVFEPNLLAHATQVTTDFAASCFFLAAVYALWRVARQPTALRLAGCGVMSGLALASKHSSLILLPTLALLAGLEIAWKVKTIAQNPSPRGPALRREILVWMGRLVAIYAVAILILWNFYGFRFAARPDGLPLWASFATYTAHIKGHLGPWLINKAVKFKLLPESYLFGLMDVIMVTAGPRISYLFGHLYPHAVWFYFPAAFIIKSTAGFLTLLILALGVFKSWSGERHREAAYLLIPPAIFMGAAMTAGTNLGIRHVLSVYPFLILAASAGAWQLVRRGRGWAIVVAALLVFHLASSLRARPDYMAYASELFGGTSQTYLSLSESNVDWGQGMKEARQYLEQRNIKNCWFAYIGIDDPAYYQIPCRMLNNPFEHLHEEIPPDHFRGVVLIGATELAGSYSGPGALNPFAPFQALKPTANIGGSILVYEGDIDLRRPAAVTHMARAWEFYKIKDLEAAIEEALKAQELAPDHPGPPYIVGYILAEQGRTDAAREQFRDSIRLAEAAHPEYAPAWGKAARVELAKLPK